jgi:hypothetical protein
MVIGRRPDSSPGDDESFERVPDPDFAQLPEDYGEWDEEDRPGILVYCSRPVTPERYRELQEMHRYIRYINAKHKRPDIIGRRPDENDQPLKRPKWLLPSPGDEDYCPFEDAERRGMTVEDLRAHYQEIYAHEPQALKDIDHKIARAGMP